MTLLSIAGYGAGAVALLALSTFLLPRHVTVSRSAAVKAAPAQVLALAASNAGYQQFNPYKNTDATLKIELMGPETGVGSAFKFIAKDITGVQTVAAVSDTRVDYDLDLGYMGKPKQNITAVPDGTGSQVTWTMNADMGFNPIGRVMGLFMDGMQGKVFETGLANINTALNK